MHELLVVSVLSVFVSSRPTQILLFPMEVESAVPQPLSSPTLESFEDYISVYVRFVPERIKVEKRLLEMKENAKQKRVKKEMPRYPERVFSFHSLSCNRRTGIS